MEGFFNDGRAKKAAAALFAMNNQKSDRRKKAMANNDRASPTTITTCENYMRIKQKCPTHPSSRVTHRTAKRAIVFIDC